MSWVNYSDASPEIDYKHKKSWVLVKIKTKKKIVIAYFRHLIFENDGHIDIYDFFYDLDTGKVYYDVIKWQYA